VANALAYYDTSTITAIKSFIVQDPGGFHKGSKKELDLPTPVFLGCNLQIFVIS
jgi:hypothetical protein